jgi:hypothetical protein
MIVRRQSAPSRRQDNTILVNLEASRAAARPILRRNMRHFDHRVNA